MSWQARQIVIANTYVSSNNLALSVDQFIARTIETIDLSLQVVVDEIETGRERSSEEIFQLLKGRLHQFPQLTGLIVAGPDGRLRYSPYQSPTPPVDFSDRSYFVQARETPEARLIVGEPSISKITGRHIIPLARRINLPDGSFGGVVTASLNADYVQRFFDTLNVGDAGIIALKSTDGTMLVRRPYQESSIGKNFDFTVGFQDAVRKSSSGTLTIPYESDGLWRIVGYKAVENLPFVVLVSLSRDEALANWRRMTIGQASLGAILLFVFIGMAIVLQRELHARVSAHGRLRQTVRELERARSIAEESSRVKTHFMANMSHELRTPLNAIIGFSEVIRDALMGPVDTRYRDYARDIHSSGQHLLRLISDVLDLSKVEAGRLDLYEEKVDLSEIVNDCRRLIAERAQTGGLALTIEMSPNLPFIRGDELRLKQIILNLLSNAVKFTPAGGKIIVSANATTEGGIALSVADTGIGMKAEDIPIALEPFRQLDSALNRRYDGTGLGLPLAQTLAQMHGGGLEIDSIEGRGTIVTIFLPPDRVIRQAA